MIQNNSEIRFLGYSSYFFVYGNATFEKAEVICIADNPLDENHAVKRLEVIKKVSADALLLVEKVPQGETLTVPVRDGEDTRELILTGWDLHSFSTTMGSLQKRKEEILTLKEYIKDAMNRNCWSSFYGRNGPFFQLLEKVSKDPINEGLEIINLMEKGDIFHFLYRIEQVISNALVLIRREIRHQFKSTFGERVHLLQSTIERGLENHRKVIVSVSGHFLLPSPFLKDQQADVGEFEAFLRKREFVILIPRVFAEDVLHSASLDVELKKNIRSLIPKERPGFEGSKLL